MTRQDYVIIGLSLQLSVASWFWMKAEKKASRLEGIQQVYEWQSIAEDGVCGPYDQPTTAEKRHKQSVSTR